MQQSFTLVSTCLRCRSASTTPSGSPCSSQQSVYHPGNGDPQATSAAPVSQPGWNPFGDDNFSRLTAEELLNKDFAKLAESEFSSVAAACGLERAIARSNVSLPSFFSAPAPKEKPAGSNESLIMGLNSFPGTALHPNYIDRLCKFGVSSLIFLEN